MALDQLPPPPHNTRSGPSMGQPFRWAIMVNPSATGYGSFFINGILLGWQGWDEYTIGGPFWRYWDGDPFGRRIWIQQDKLSKLVYRWRLCWWEAYEEYPIIAYYEQSSSFSRMPWDDVGCGAPWSTFTPSFDWHWLPVATWVYWYRTAQDALVDFPYALRQDDYLQTFGRSLWA